MVFQFWVVWFFLSRPQKSNFFLTFVQIHSRHTSDCFTCSNHCPGFHLNISVFWYHAATLIKWLFLVPDSSVRKNAFKSLKNLWIDPCWWQFLLGDLTETAGLGTRVFSACYEVCPLSVLRSQTLHLNHYTLRNRCLIILHFKDIFFLWQRT